MDTLILCILVILLLGGGFSTIYITSQLLHLALLALFIGVVVMLVRMLVNK